MKTKHTPGPWVANRDNGIMEVKNWKRICSAYNIGVAEEQEYNALLIAAAPDLLEALKSTKNRDFVEMLNKIENAGI